VCGVFCADKDAEGVGAQSARRRTWRQELPGVQHRAHGVMGNAGGDEGRTAFADLLVSPESAPMTSVSHGVMGITGGDEGRITTAVLQVASEAAQMSSELRRGEARWLPCAWCGCTRHRDEVGDRMCYCDVCEGSWHEQPWLATVQCVLMEPELQVASEAAQESSELRRANGDAGGDEGRLTTGDLHSTPEVRISTAEGALCADKDAVFEGVEQAGCATAAASVQPGAAAVQRAAVVVQADSIAWQEGLSEGLAEDVSRSSELQGAGDAVGRVSAAGVRVTPKGLSMNSEVLDAGSDVGRTDTTGRPAPNRRARRAAAAADPKHSAGAAAVGARGEEELLAARLRAAYEDAIALLQDFTTCGCGGVGSTAAHRRAQRRRQANTAAVAAGLVGNRCAVLSLEREVDVTSVVPLVPGSGRTRECSSVSGAAEAAEAPWCGHCAGALAGFVCTMRELGLLLEVVREAAHYFTTCPSAEEGRRRLARLEQVMVCAELEGRVCEEGSPTFRATLAEIQLCLLA
jgi:hypothetical protein